MVLRGNIFNKNMYLFLLSLSLLFTGGISRNKNKNNIDFGQPRITKLSIKGNNTYISIYSDRPWKLYSTTDFRHYNFLYSSEPMVGFSYQFFEGIDWGGGYGARNFYVLSYVAGEAVVHEVPPRELY